MKQHFPFTLIQHSPSQRERGGSLLSLFTLHSSLFTLLLLSCTAEGWVEDGSSVATAPIAFDSYTAQLVTRAEEVSREIPTGESIGIYAYYHDGLDTNSDGTSDTDGTWSVAATPNFMFNQQCTNRGNGGSFVYAPLKYWPNEPHDKVSFIAYYPYTDPEAADDASNPVSKACTGVTPQMLNSDTGLPSFDFSVNPDVTKQKDLLVSDLLTNLPNGTMAIRPSGTPDRDHLTTADYVHFYFRHALAKVEFRIVVHPDIRPYFSKLKVNTITLTDVKDKGTLTLAYDPSAGTAFTWTNLGTTSAGEHAHTYDPINLKEAYLMVPQTLPDAMHLTLNFELTLKGYRTVYTYESNQTIPQDVYTYPYNNAFIQLNRMKNPSTGAYVTEWLPNTHYIYTIRVNAKRIDFTAQVVDWGDAVDINGITVEEKI